MAVDNTSNQRNFDGLFRQEQQTQRPNHQRSASWHIKRTPPAHLRATRPAPFTKRYSYPGGNKTGKKVSQLKSDGEDVNDSRGAMATSFLQFCATCEKQIIVPNNALLYCSDKCRRADKHSYTYEYTPPPSPFSRLSLDETHHRDIVPLRSPTMLPSSNSSCHFTPSTSPSRSDSPSNRYRESEAAHYLHQFYHESEAARYLRQFQPGGFAPTTSRRSRRPRYGRASPSIAPLTATGSSNGSSNSNNGEATSSSAAPSLSHTPTSTASFTMPFTPSTIRPLAPRAHPYSTSASARMDLVTPFQSCASPRTNTPGSLPSYHSKSEPSIGVPTTASVIADGTNARFGFEKREPGELTRAGAQPGSLKHLFTFDAMKKVLPGTGDLEIKSPILSQG